MSDGLLDFSHGITAIDTGFVRPRLDASHLLVRDGRAAFVDTGTGPSVPRLIEALAAKDIDPSDVDYVFLTHIHLDHAGGAGELCRHLPAARVCVHPRGAAHLADPRRLVEGTLAVYGEEAFRRYYGDVRPIPAERLVVVEDGQRLTLGKSTLTFLHTPGHALHHVSIVDEEARGIFAGDTFGVSYRELDGPRGEFIFPATTPVHFDPDAAHASIDRLMAERPTAIYLTHYSRVADLERLASDLHRGLRAFVAITEEAAARPDPLSAIVSGLRDYLCSRLREHGIADAESLTDDVLSMDIELNAKGLLVWLGRRAH